MKRREFVGLMGGVSVWPVVARAQQSTMPVIGLLSSASAAPFAHLVAAFRRGLQEAGFVEDRNVAVEYRWAEGQYERVSALAAELVSRRVTVIVTSGGDIPVLAAKVATTTIPIVFIVAAIQSRPG